MVPEGGRVCVIGGGTIGLLAAKNCVDEGLVPTVFERTRRVGGVWRQDEEPSRVAYDSLYTNSSGCLMNISDFPLRANLQDYFPRRRDICEYYEAYVEKFGLDGRLRFGSEVRQVVAGSSGGWDVVVSPTEATDGEQEERLHFDAVMVCTGQFSNPSTPQLPRSATVNFRGRLRHSASYRNAEGLGGKAVVVVGIGNSALDISLEAARAGATVSVVCRHGTNIVPVADAGAKPVDQVVCSRLWDRLPSALRGLLFLRLVKGTNRAFLQHGMPPPLPGSDGGFANLKEHVEYRDMLQSGRIRFFAGSIEDFGEDSVTVTGGATVPADDVIFCTGYRLEFPFLPPHLEDELVVVEGGRRQINAYKLIMHPRAPTLCVLGCLLTFGNESCVGEVQARWALGLWSGRVQPPLEGALVDDLARRRKGQRYPNFVPYVRYLDSLAGDLGIRPELSWLEAALDPLLAWKLYSAPVTCSQYRLVGPHRWDGARDVVLSTPGIGTRLAGVAWRPPDDPTALRAGPPPHSRL